MATGSPELHRSGLVGDGQTVPPPLPLRMRRICGSEISKWTSVRRGCSLRRSCRQRQRSPAESPGQCFQDVDLTLSGYASPPTAPSVDETETFWQPQIGRPPARSPRLEANRTLNLLGLPPRPLGKPTPTSDPQRPHGLAVSSPTRTLPQDHRREVANGYFERWN